RGRAVRERPRGARPAQARDGGDVRRRMGALSARACGRLRMRRIGSFRFAFRRVFTALGAAAFLMLSACGGGGGGGNTVTILNVSYDPTRELYRNVNARFTQQWLAET